MTMKSNKFFSMLEMTNTYRNQLWNQLWIHKVFEGELSIWLRWNILLNIFQNMLWQQRYYSNREDVFWPLQTWTVTLTLLVNNSDQFKKMQKNLKNDWNPGKWVLIWECSVRAIKWVPTWQVLDGFRKSLSCALDKSRLGIGRVKAVEKYNTGLFHHFLNTVTRRRDGKKTIPRHPRPPDAGLIYINIQPIVLTGFNPSNVEATFLITQGCKDLWKPSKPCHVGILCKALAE